MKIIILGAGQVGGTLAENLVGENNDITVVDKNADRLRDLQDKYDLRVVNGHASHPDVLREAGAQDADMLVAVTNTDETNMAACQVAFTLFNTPNRIARIRSPQYLAEKEALFQSGAVPVDHLIAPEELVTSYIERLIQYPGALQVVSFAEEKVSLVAVKAYYGGPLVGNALSAYAITCRTSILAWQRFSVRDAQFVRKAPPLLKRMMKCFSSPRVTIFAR